MRDVTVCTNNDKAMIYFVYINDVIVCMNDDGSVIFVFLSMTSIFASIAFMFRSIREGEQVFLFSF